MQKRHFELIAEVIRSLPHDATKIEVTLAFADALAQTNELFDEERFRAACVRLGDTDD